MPPVIVDDLIVYGTAGADWGGQGWIGAFKLEDGAPHREWRRTGKIGWLRASVLGANDGLRHLRAPAPI
jgi:alcohol dehydrogenase (cytochrome c)